MAIWSRLETMIFGFGIGGQVSRVLDPLGQSILNSAWPQDPSRPLLPEEAAELAAQRYAGGHADAGEAVLSGVNGDRFAALRAMLESAPDNATALELLRRELIQPADLEHAHAKHRLEERWSSPLAGLLDILLAPADLANARQQGFESDLDLDLEAKHLGLTPNRLELLHKLAGLPPGIETALEMWRRNIIGESEFAEIVRTGHTKTKWTKQLERLKDRILTADTWARLRLKGWATQSEAAAGGALDGYSAELMDKLYLSMGRPPSPTQMWSAWARGAPSPDGGAVTEADFAKAIKESDIRPEWAPMLWAIRYVYPSLFQMRQLVSSKVLDRPTALDILHKERYPDDLAAKMVDGWLKGGAAGAKELTVAELEDELDGGYITATDFRLALKDLGYDPAHTELLVHLSDARRVKTYRNLATSKIRSLYVAHKIGRPAAIADLDALGIAAEAQAQLLKFWDVERDATRAQLTASQIQTAYRRELLDQATAVTELEDRGYAPGDALLLLGEAPTLLNATQVQKALKDGVIDRGAATSLLEQAGYSPADAEILVETAVGKA